MGHYGLSVTHWVHTFQIRFAVFKCSWLILCLPLNSSDAINLNNAHFHSASAQSAWNELELSEQWTLNTTYKIKIMPRIELFREKKMIFLCCIFVLVYLRLRFCSQPAAAIARSMSLIFPFSHRPDDYMEIYVVKFQRFTSSASICENVSASSTSTLCTAVYVVRLAFYVNGES